MTKIFYIFYIFFILTTFIILYNIFSVKTNKNNKNNKNNNNLGYNDIKKMYVINLKKNNKRYNDFMINTRNANVNVSRFNATYGIELAENDPYIKKYFKDNINLTKPQLGCAISHIKIWEDAVRNNYDTVVIFEDDAIIPPNFKEKINIVFNQLPKDWDMLLLGINSGYCKKYRFANNLLSFEKGRNFIIKKTKGNWGLFAYVLNIKFIKELLKQKFTTTVDNYIRDKYYYNDNYNIFLSNPIIVHHEYDNYSDIINKNRKGEMINNNIKIYNGLTNLIFM
jgi:GR25 family glycosyltransferase involved in LPS biosynthesis